MKKLLIFFVLLSSISSFGQVQRPNQSVSANTITYAASVTIDWSIAQTQIITLKGNCAFTNSSATSGELLHLKVIQDTTGGRTISFASLKYPGGVAPVLSSSANAVDILTILYDGTNYNLIGVAFDVK